MGDRYDDQLRAARYRAERDQARQELAKLKDRSRDTTVSAYDLLTEEDREALRWVREQGGLEEVRKRLMPEGCEWPRYESGEPVRAMDEFADCFGRTHRAVAIGLMSATYVLQDSDSQTGELRTINQCPYGSPVKRPAALAADDEPLREGEMVWEVETGDGYVVERIYSGTTEPDFPGHTVACHRPDDIVTHMFKPSQLTHTKPEHPDSWERWRKEWQWPPVKYCELILGVEYDHDTQLNEAFDAQGDDLVRRAKALAGVSE